MRCCARLRRAPATIFWARVIFCVFLTLPMRLRSDFRSGTALPRGSGLLRGRDEALAKGLEQRLELRLQVVRDRLLLADGLEDVGVLRLDVRVELRLVLR